MRWKPSWKPRQFGAAITARCQVTGRVTAKQKESRAARPAPHIAGDREKRQGFSGAGATACHGLPRPRPSAPAACYLAPDRPAAPPRHAECGVAAFFIFTDRSPRVVFALSVVPGATHHCCCSCSSVALGAFPAITPLPPASIPCLYPLPLPLLISPERSGGRRSADAMSLGQTFRGLHFRRR